MKLNDDEINALVVGLMHFKRILDEEKPADRRKFFAHEKARDRQLLPSLIQKLNHAKNVTVTGRFSWQGYNYRFFLSDDESLPPSKST